jgi:uncharacterized integral membrane protein (TIGR00697 family)
MNELLLIGQAVASAAAVLLTWRFARDKLSEVIVVFLILITIGGGKLVPFFGHVTNSGNIFYAGVFLATYFLIERMGKRQGIYSTWLAVIFVAFFFIFIQIIVQFTSAPVTSSFSNALEDAFAPFSRLTAASLIAFVLSQNLNVYLYIYLKERWNGEWLWLRANIASFIALILGSAVFFTIAFWGIVAPANVVDVVLTGITIKVLFIAITSPLLYLNRIESEDGSDYSEISVR